MAREEEIHHDLSREVYGIFGIPVDALGMVQAVDAVKGAISAKRRLLLSTPNLNFLVQSFTNEQFRESLLRSDLCLADGAPIVWLARLLGVPIRQRVAGSDLFEALKANRWSGEPIRMFIFGGAENLAERVCNSLNLQQGGAVGSGWHDPGFVSVDAMSSDEIVEKINSSRADFLSVSLGAQKGQAWLLHNHDRLKVPVRVHLGATINFAAGTIRRSPKFLQRIGLEWLWRIKEEPHLASRYWTDGVALINLIFGRALPLMFLSWYFRLRHKRDVLEVSYGLQGDLFVICLSGKADATGINRVIPVLTQALASSQTIVIDMSSVEAIDARFVGLLLMVAKANSDKGGLHLINVSPNTDRWLRLNGFGYLLEGVDRSAEPAKPHTTTTWISDLSQAT